MSAKRTIVIKLSGGAVHSGTAIDLDYLERFGRFIANITKTWRVALTVGGGCVARHYITAVKQLGLSDTKASLLGGDVGLMNCRLAIAAMTRVGVRTPCIPIEDFSVALEKVNEGAVPVLFGRWPALTSDSVAVYFADYISADIVLKLSRIDSIYESDPSLSIDAKRNARLTHVQLESLAMQNDHRVAGESFVVDVLAAKRLKNSGIPLWLLHISELDLAQSTLLQVPTSHFAQGTLVGDVSV
jgi:uridylate kinase